MTLLACRHPIHWFFQGGSGLCWGRSGFNIVDLTFHGHWNVCPVPCQPPCSGNFAWLGSHSSLATRKGASIEVVKARCQSYSSKLCLSFGANGPRSLQQMQLPKKYTQLWDSYQPALSKMVINRDCAEQNSDVASL